MAAIPVPSSLTYDQIVQLLKPGDCLLYHPVRFDLLHPGWIFGAAIRFKTWHNVSHCELFIGGARRVSAAARDGRGVGLYPLRTSELQYILRPTQPLDWKAFWPWFYRVNGEGYDWLGLLRFAWFKEIGRGDNGKMFCSEFLTRAYRALGADVISPDEDADAVAPANFLLSPNLESLTYGRVVSQAA